MKRKKKCWTFLELYPIIFPKFPMFSNFSKFPWFLLLFQIFLDFQKFCQIFTNFQKIFLLSWFFHFLERYCPDPVPPHENGGLSDWDSTLTDITPYNTRVTYSCDIARQFLDSSVINYTSIYEAIYPTQTRTCQWDQTWSPAKEVRFFLIS